MSSESPERWKTGTRYLAFELFALTKPCPSLFECSLAEFVCLQVQGGHSLDLGHLASLPDVAVNHQVASTCLPTFKALVLDLFKRAS